LKLSITASGSIRCPSGSLACRRNIVVFIYEKDEDQIEEEQEEETVEIPTKTINQVF
jgi:hypothetical protein